MKINRRTTKGEVRSPEGGDIGRMVSRALSEGRVVSSEFDEPCRRIGLTPRQAGVMSGMFFGKTDKEIGVELGISHRTVSGHVEDILRELRVTTRGAAIKVLIDVHFSCPHRAKCKLRYMAEIPSELR